ncbi:aminopeptidase P family N-terminal domain-containing protein, partial [Rhizobium sp. TRM95111]|uniref:aminopeptidase P family N-terminal domain-containing protein n=1 Tax=Rhizobium alarense TaxID=2846851 RepID=UPI001F44FEB4
MFQSFDVTSTPQFGAARTDALRATFDGLGIDGFLVPRADEFQGEYVPSSAERLAWLTGFTGSAGVALVTRNQAIVFVDGRYVTQLAEQVDGHVFSGGDLVNEPPHLWLRTNAPKGFRLGIDPWLHTGGEVRRLKAALEAAGGELVPLADNPLDRIWEARPAEPLGRVTIQALDHAGELARDKLVAMAAETTRLKADALAVTDPSSIAWIFNIRGSDVPHTPHPLARAIVPAEGRPQLFLDKRKTGIEQEAYLTQLCDLLPPSAFEGAIDALAATGARLLIDPDQAPYALAERIRAKGGTVVEAPDP